ncbi:MAG: hypothetical protein ACHQVS_00445 [Candidatus Babeliales bacterium]
MKWMIVISIVSVGILNAQVAPDKDASLPLVIQNTNSIKVENKRDLRDCSSCVGSEFKACMRALTKEDFATNIRALHPRACTAYVQQLEKDEIIEIRKLFTVEEWQELPPIFTHAVYEHFEVERKKAEDALWDRILVLLVRIGAFND